MIIMDIDDATETAYKNGYEAGARDFNNELNKYLHYDMSHSWMTNVFNIYQLDLAHVMHKFGIEPNKEWFDSLSKKDKDYILREDNE